MSVATKHFFPPKHIKPKKDVQIVLAHATGLCKETWEPFVEDLYKLGFEYPVTALDMRGHGDSPVPDSSKTNDPSRPYNFHSWSDFAQDVLQVTDWIKQNTQPKHIVGIGLSKGGAALTIAELIRPGTFSGLVLLEPIIFTPLDPAFGKRVEQTPLALKAETRREHFPSIDFAIKYFEGKAMTNGWDPRSVVSYTKGTLKSQSDGFVLKCERKVEAETYREGSEHTTYYRLPEIKTHVAVIAGDDSGIYTKEVQDSVVSQLKNVKSLYSERIPGCNHFVPLEKPKHVANFVNKFVHEKFLEAKL